MPLKTVESASHRTFNISLSIRLPHPLQLERFELLNSSSCVSAKHASTSKSNGPYCSTFFINLYIISLLLHLQISEVALVALAGVF